MKKLKLLTTIICLSLSLSSCISSYVHNTIKAPSLDTNTVADISSDISPRHINLSACIKANRHLQVLATGYYSTNPSQYYDLGLGYHTKTARKAYRGFYGTIGYGKHDGVTNKVPPLSSGEYRNINCSYARLSFTLYTKSARRKTMRYYAALRSSLTYYIKYEEDYVWFKFMEDTYSGHFKSSNFAQVMFEPVFGIEKILWKGLYIYGQSSLTWTPLAKIAALEGHIFVFPQHTLLSMRFGVGYVWQKSDRKRINKG